MNGPVDLTGYHLSFDAEMTSASDMNYFINTFNNGNTTIPSNNELENYASYSAGGNTYSFQNGALVITASPTPSGGLPYTSGLISTGYSFYQNQGYFEMRAQLPSTSGFWPAFWMLAGGPTDYFSELDTIEQPNNDGANNYFTSIKTAQYNAGGFNNAGVDLSSGYHSYGVMWTSNSIQFTFDGQYIGQAVATPAALQAEKMYLFANLAVGGWASTPASGASAQLKIDYIRAYSNDPNVPTWWGGVEPISSPDGVDTTPNLTGTPSPVQTPTPISTPILTPTPTNSAGPVVIGSGNDTLALFINEDAYNGDAQFTVSVDGTQVGGTQTATASHAAGGTMEFDVKGTFGTGAHTATVNFTNDADGGAPSLDRNLYVTGAVINGTTAASSSLNEYSGGPQSFTFQGGDTLTLGVSEDAYQGDAQYRVLVDGYYVGGTYTATASHAAGLINTQTVSGNWGKGGHTVGIQFINDAYGGAPSLDRNLYVNSVSFDGAAAPMSGTLKQATNGVTDVTLPPTSTLTLDMSEDAWQGDAQFSLTVDGKQVATNTSVTASHAAGATQMLDFNAGLTAGLHDIGISFTNDAYGGSSSTDRNLYLTGASLNGTALGAAAWTQAFYGNGTNHFSLVVPSS